MDYDKFSQEFDEKQNAEMEAKLADIEANADKELLDFHYNQDTKQRWLKQKEEIFKTSKSDKQIIKEIKREKENNKFYSADFPELCELVEENGNTKFLTFDKQIIGQIKIDDQMFYPPEKVDWILPNGEEVLRLATQHSDLSDGKDNKLPHGQCNKCNELYCSLLDYFKIFSEMLTESHYHFLVEYTLHTYLIEKFIYSPILFFIGSGGRGKTPTLKAIAYSARRGIFTETFREANIIRWGGDYKASLFFDTKNFPKKVEFANCEDVIYGRAERGVSAARVLFPEKGAFRDMKSFSTFGPTGATSNFMVDDLTEMRCVVMHMPYSHKVFNIDPTPELGFPFKNELTAFRLAHFHIPFIDLKKDKPGKMENYLIGIHQMIKTHFPQYEDEYLKFKEVIKEDKLESSENSFEARITKLVSSMKEFVEDGTLCLTYEDLCDKYNEDTSKDLYPKTMSTILRGLGFQSKRNASGTKRGIFYDDFLIKRLLTSYGIEYPQSASESSETSETADTQVQGCKYCKFLDKKPATCFWCKTIYWKIKTEEEEGEAAIYNAQQLGLQQAEKENKVEESHIINGPNMQAFRKKYGLNPKI